MNLQWTILIIRKISVWLNGLQYLLNAVQEVHFFISCFHSIYPPSMCLASFIQGRFIFSSCPKKIELFIQFPSCAVIHFGNSSDFNFWLDIFWLNLSYEVKNLVYGTICICTCLDFFFLWLEWILVTGDTVTKILKTNSTKKFKN